MCFRPSAPTHNNNGGPTCQTCGMPIEAGASTCPYCGDPIPPDPPDEFSDIDPSHSTRIL